tara:strand:- start:10143 stop:10295 length:153 start_codon:yes stop_codon:yes gene_type:complete
MFVELSVKTVTLVKKLLKMVDYATSITRTYQEKKERKIVFYKQFKKKIYV